MDTVYKTDAKNLSFVLSSIYQEQVPPPPKYFYVVGYYSAPNEVELLEKTFTNLGSAKEYCRRNKHLYSNGQLHIFQQSLGKYIETV